MRICALAVLLLLACAKPAPVAERAEAGAKASLPASSARVAFAHFENGQLTDCTDVITDGSIGDVERRMTDEQKISQPCVKAFADRTTLAMCTVEQTRDGGVNEKIVLAYYDFAQIGLSDKSMSDCLSEGGSWNPLSRESPLFRRAKLEYSQRQLQKAAGRLNGMQP